MKSRKRWFWLACEHRRILVGKLQLFRFMCVMMLQTKCKLNNAELFSNCSIFRARKLETINATKNQQNVKNGTMRFRLNIDVRKEMEDSRLNAIKQLITFVKGRLNFSCKSTTAANVDLTESLLDNWLKNIITFAVCLYSFFTNFSFQILFPNCRKPAEKQNPVATR